MGSTRFARQRAKRPVCVSVVCAGWPAAKGVGDSRTMRGEAGKKSNTESSKEREHDIRPLGRKFLEILVEVVLARGWTLFFYF